MNIMKYRYLLFDLDETLLDFTVAQRAALQEVIKKYNFPEDADIYDYYKALNDSLWKKFERGEISKEELIKTRFSVFCDHYGMKYPADGGMERCYQDALGKSHFLMPDAFEVVGRLSRHFRMFLVTNGFAVTQYSRIEKSGLSPFFEEIFVSEKVGAQKPSQEYFQYIYEFLKKPDKKDMIIIGDSLSSDILGGKQFGIDTCHVCLRKQTPVYTKLVPTYTITSLKELFTILYEQP